MGRFMVLYKSSATAAEQMGADPEQTAAGMKLWMDWAAKAGNALVDLGSPLNEAATVPSGSGNGGPHIGGYSIMQGDSVGAVNALLEDHPHLNAPDASIEVLEILEVPGMG
ncbi:MAG: hypothetical protein JOZ75_00275 [Candidatus Dormibacteraeota bacterium]|nr:hypothetical protein [Candidatus Dormibacteraeota bacterium]